MSAPAETAGSTRPRMTSRQRAVLLLLLGSTFLLAADLSLLNVAIPLIGSDLGFRVDDLQWIATAFALSAAGLTLLCGRVGDLVGRKRMFVWGTLLLVAASVLGGVAQDAGTLIGARVLQGVATAMATPAALTLITTSFPEGPLRARALGANGATVSAGFTVGAVLSGLLTDLLSWRWAFWINVPIGLLIVVFALFLLTESRVPHRTRLDIPGAVTVSLGLAALVYGVSRAADLGWTSPIVLGFLAAAAGLLTLFWQIELRADQPLASVRVLSRATVRWGNIGGLTTIAMQTAVIFLTSLYLQEVAGQTALRTGLAFAVIGIAAFLGGTFAPRLIGRVGSPRALAIGLAIQAIGPLGLVLLSGTSIPLILTVLCVGAFGHVTAVVSYMVTGTSGLPDDEQGLATGLASMTQQVALAVGIPILSAVATARLHTLESTHTAADSVLGGIRLALTVDAAILLLACLAVTVGLRSKPQP